MKLTRLKNFLKGEPDEDEVVVVVLVTLRPLSSTWDETTTVGSLVVVVWTVP